MTAERKGHAKVTRPSASGAFDHPQRPGPIDLTSPSDDAGRPALFSIRLAHYDNALILQLAGELDIAAGEHIDGALANVHLFSPDRIEIDVSGLTFMDIGGLYLLLAIQTRRLDEGRPGVCVRGAVGTVRRIFDLTGFTSLLDDPHPIDPTDDAMRKARLCRGVESGRQAANLTVTDLFVDYFALGGTADLGQLHAYLRGESEVFNSHQRDLAVHAVNERLCEMGASDRVLAYANADNHGSPL
jgi:anti-anti-sigma factor